MKVSIIVPVCNHWKDLTKSFIRNLAKYTKNIDFELIIVNNSSTDDTKINLSKIQKKYKALKVVNSRKNLGYAVGCNIGYKYSTGDCICFLNNDVVIKDPKWLQKLISVSEACDNNVLLGKELIKDNKRTIFRGKITEYIPGYLIFAARQVFAKVVLGGKIFDENFGKGYFEDVDLSVRIKKADSKLQAVSNLNIVHMGSKSSDLLNLQKQIKIAKAHFTNKMMQLHLKEAGKKRIVFFDRCFYPYSDPDYEGKGVGSTAACVILLAREFAKANWQVEVYNITQKPGTYNSVEYHHILDFKPKDYCDVFVLCRKPEPTLRYVNAISKIFWSCEQQTIGDWRHDIFPFVDKILAISPYHAKYLQKQYGLGDEKIKVIDLGINYQDYKDPLAKKPGKLIYCSIPIKGLDNLIDLFPKIKEKVPDASLYITSDFRLWGYNDPKNHEYKKKFENLPNVYFLGKVSRKDLVYHQQTAEVMTYPCVFEECFCISALECIASGAIPVTTNIGALKTTVGESGITLDGMPGDSEYDQTFVESVVKLLTDKRSAESLRIRGRERALKDYSWSKIIQKWLCLIKDLENKDDGRELICKKCKKNFTSSYALIKHKAESHVDYLSGV